MYALWGDLADCQSTMEFWAEGAAAPSTWTYRFDENGDLRWAQLSDKTGFVNMTIAFEYDALGALAGSITNPRADGSGSRTRVAWRPNGDFQLLVDGNADGKVDSRSYTTQVDGRSIATADDEGDDGRMDGWVTNWEEGVFQARVLEEHTMPDGDSVERSSFDSLGRLVQTDAWTDDRSLPNATSWRGYDALGRALWKESDNDGDGVPETRASWTWRCP